MELSTDHRMLGRAPAYTARPAGVDAPLPAIIVIQEVWGVDGHIEDLTRRFATCGYLAVAPDLYADGEQRPEAVSRERIEALKRFLDTAPPTVWRDPDARDAALHEVGGAEEARLRETMAVVLTSARPIDRYVETLRQTAAAVRAEPDCDGAVVSTGYCLGGLLSVRLAGADGELRGAASYYGAAPDMADMGALSCPLIGFYGADDTRITSQVPGLVDALHAAGHELETHVYPDTPHAFFNDTRPSYRVVAARDAWARTLSFFAAAVGEPG